MTTATTTLGPWAVITGASSGIGRAFAIEAARRGLSVVLNARRGDVLEELAADIEREFHVETRVVPLDMSERDAVARLDEATSNLDVGLLIASAGFGSSGPFLTSDIEAEAEMVDVNCRALMMLAHRFGPRLTARASSGMVLMSSLVAFQGAPFAGNYAATKAYVQSLAEAIAHETRGTGLRVVACAPGPVRSGFASRAGMTMDAASTPESVARGTMARLSRGGTARPDGLSKFLAWSLATLPRWGRVRVMAKIMGGMSGASGKAATNKEAPGDHALA